MPSWKAFNTSDLHDASEFPPWYLWFSRAPVIILFLHSNLTYSSLSELDAALEATSVIILVIDLFLLS